MIRRRLSGLLLVGLALLVLAGVGVVVLNGFGIGYISPVPPTGRPAWCHNGYGGLAHPSTTPDPNAPIICLMAQNKSRMDIQVRMTEVNNVATEMVGACEGITDVKPLADTGFSVEVRPAANLPGSQLARQSFGGGKTIMVVAVIGPSGTAQIWEASTLSLAIPMASVC